MKKMVNDEVNRNKPALYLCCEWCDKAMTKSYVCIWKENSEGKSHHVTLLHYGCRKRFEAGHKGKWLSRGMPASSIQW